MTKDELGGFPYDVETRGNSVILRFYPRPGAKDPGAAVLKLSLGKEDLKKLLKILVDNI